MADPVAIGGLVAGIAAAGFGALAWLAARQRQPFKIRRDGDHVLLTRTRRPQVQIRLAYVFGHAALPTADQALTAEWRYLMRDSHLVLSLAIFDNDGEPIANPVSPHETLTVQYRYVWPWETRWRVLRKRNEVGEHVRLDERGKWREWRSPML